MRSKTLNRRKFFTILGVEGAALAGVFVSDLASGNQQDQGKPATKITNAGKKPRNSASMPGKFPGKVILVQNPGAVVNGALSSKFS
jgi:hypothetical protein